MPAMRMPPFFRYWGLAVRLAWGETWRAVFVDPLPKLGLPALPAAVVTLVDWAIGGAVDLEQLRRSAAVFGVAYAVTLLVAFFVRLAGTPHRLWVKDQDEFIRLHKDSAEEIARLSAPRNLPADLDGLRAWTQEQLQAQQEQLRVQQDRLQEQQDRIETIQKRRAALKWLTRQEKPMVETARWYVNTHASAESEIDVQETIARTLDYVEKQLGADYRQRLTDWEGKIFMLGDTVDLARVRENVPADKAPLINHLVFMVSEVRQIVKELEREEEGGDVTKKP